MHWTKNGRLKDLILYTKNSKNFLFMKKIESRQTLMGVTTHYSMIHFVD
jgi:hypothetical protein